MNSFRSSVQRGASFGAIMSSLDGCAGWCNEAHPRTAELVVEVAVSSAALDREGATMYAEAGVKEYWIVLAPERHVEVYRQPVGGIYQEKKLFRIGETIDCSTVPGVRVRVSELFPN